MSDESANGNNGNNNTATPKRGLASFLARYFADRATSSPSATPPNVPAGERSPVGLTLPTPQLHTSRSGKKKIAEFQTQLTEGVALMEHMERYQEAQSRLEASTQKVEQTFARGAAELRLLRHVQWYEQQSADLEIAQKLDAQRHAGSEQERQRELADMQHEIDRHRKRAELAQAKEQARAAELHEEEQRARVERRRASAPADAPDPLDDLDAPPEVQAALSRHAKQRDARRWAQRQRDIILQSVGVDETRLSQRQRDELDDIETAAAAAQEAINTREAAAIVYPFAGDDPTDSR